MQILGAKNERERIVVRTSIIGTIVNLLLALFKGIIGILSNSIAVTLDAVNNLSDALSSVITIIGTKLAGRPPDKNHPLGYGRIEYLTTMAISAIVLYAGINAIIESVGRIITPEAVDYSTVSLMIIGVAVVVKIFLGRYFRSVGRKVNSDALVASGTDALYDAILSASVLVSAIIFIVCNISLEAYVGAVIAAFIIKTGVEMMKDTLDDILGRRVDKSFSDKIKETICEEECVMGAYDLILHNYGPTHYVGSVHVEIPDNMSASEIDMMERRISRNVFLKHGVVLAGIGIYTTDTEDEEVSRIRSDVIDRVMCHEGVIQMHGFFIDTKEHKMFFDVVLDFGSDRRTAYEDICREIQDAYPDYEIRITMDVDV